MMTVLQATSMAVQSATQAPSAPAAAGANDVLFILVLTAFVLLLALEILRPYRNYGAKVAHDSFVTNTTAFLFNNILMSLLSASSLFVVAEHYGRGGLLSGLDNTILTWFVSFLVFDFAIYVWHAAGHRFEIFWRFHKIHHSDKSLNVTTGFRFHVFDLFLELLYKCAIVIIFGLQATVVLGCELVRMLFVLFHHSNLSFKGEQWLSQLIITPALHRVHHSTLRSEHDSNYGIALSIWDRLFGTRKELVPEKIGLDLIEAENFVQLFCLVFITERRVQKLLRMLPRGRR